MAITKEELHKMKDAEMIEELERLRGRLFELRTIAVTEKIENHREPGNLRKDIARILTEQNMRRLSKKQAAAN